MAYYTEDPTVLRIWVDENNPGHWMLDGVDDDGEITEAVIELDSFNAILGEVPAL